MLLVWAQRSPTYVRAILNGVDCYREFISSAPTVVVGDFNSHWRWDANDRAANHTVMVERLRAEFGLVSAFHAKADGAPEVPTLYWQWKMNQPFHIDYCFVPSSWLPRVQSVEIGGYDEWADESDHRTLLVDIA